MITFAKHSTPFACTVVSWALACGGSANPSTEDQVGAFHAETHDAPRTGAVTTGDVGEQLQAPPQHGLPPELRAMDVPVPPAPPSDAPPPRRSCLAEPGCPWSTRAGMPTPARGLAAVAHAGHIYLLGGESLEDAIRVTPRHLAEDPDELPPLYTAVRAYDPASDSWSAKARLPIGLYVLTAHSLGGKLYAFGGYGENGFDATVQEYDPSSDTWLLREPMPTPRYIFTSQVIADKVYVIGGQGPSATSEPEHAPTWEHLRNVDIFDPDTGWSSGAPAPEPLAGGASCAMDGRIFVFGGEANNLTSVYDVTADTWSEAAPPPLARNGHACVTLGSSFFLVGGRNSSGGVDIAEQYDPMTDTWQTLEPMPTPRHWFGAAALGESIFVFGGEEEPSYTWGTFGLSSEIEVLRAH